MSQSDHRAYPVFLKKAGILLLFLMLGCQSKYHAQYEIILDEPDFYQGEALIGKQGSKDSYIFHFRDDWIELVFELEKDAIRFTLTNLAETPLTISWERAAFIDRNGKSHPILHEGIAIQNRYQTQIPTVVLKEETIRERVFPASYVYFDRLDNQWYSYPIMPHWPKGGDSREELAEAVAPYRDRFLFQLKLPITHNGRLYEYIFPFKVENVQIQERN